MMGSGGANNGGGVSAGGQSWFSNGSLAYSAGGDTDETGWRPSGVGGIPSSAPVLGSKSKSKTGLDDVLEDPGQKQFVTSLSIGVCFKPSTDWDIFQFPVSSSFSRRK